MSAGFVLRRFLCVYATTGRRTYHGSHRVSRFFMFYEFSKRLWSLVRSTTRVSPLAVLTARLFEGYVEHIAVSILLHLISIIAKHLAIRDCSSNAFVSRVNCARDRQAATVSDDREPHRTTDDRVSHEESRRPWSGTGGTVPGGLRDVHVGAAAW